MHSATPEPAASKSSLSMLPSASGWSSATTVAGSILKCCMLDARDIGGSRVCANGRKELAPDSAFGAARGPEQKSRCPSLIRSPSNPEGARKQQSVRRIHWCRGPDIKEGREGRIQSAERAVPTHPNKTEGYEPSFSLIGADSRHALKGDSYVRRSLPAPT